MHAGTRGVRLADASQAAAVHPALGIVVLVVVAALNIQKPRGLTRFGQRPQSDKAQLSSKQQKLPKHRQMKIDQGEERGRISGRPSAS